MRLLHTADWHLGRSFHGHNLVEDQTHVLDQFVKLALDLRPDAVLIAGDVYDRMTPPEDAVALLDLVLTRLVVEQRVPVCLIAGNHDSPERINFGGRLLTKSGLTMVGTTRTPAAYLDIDAKNGRCRIHALPYAEPAKVAAVFATGTAMSHAEAMQRQLDHVRATHPADRLSIVVAHAFVQGATESESERQLCIGGADRVPTNTFAGIHYTALGHLHKPQDLADGRVRYSGSLLKYSVSEAPHEKSVTLVELGKDGFVRTEAHPLSPRHNVRVIEGSLATLLARAPSEQNRHDYVHATLTDAGTVLDPIDRLREHYPNILGVVRKPPVREASAAAAAASRDPQQRTTEQLFQQFFEHQEKQPLNRAQTAALYSELQALQRKKEDA